MASSSSPDATGVHENNHSAEERLAVRAAHVLALVVGGAFHEIHNALSYVLGNATYLSDELSRAQFRKNNATPQSELVEASNELAEGANRVKRSLQDLHAFVRTFYSEDAVGLVDFGRPWEQRIKLQANPAHLQTLKFRGSRTLPRLWLPNTLVSFVVVELIDNTRHGARKNQSPQATVELDYFASEELLRISVVDTGAGFKKKFLERWQGRGWSGLSLIRQISERLGGTTTLSNRRTGGARVTVFLPAEEIK